MILTDRPTPSIHPRAKNAKAISGNEDGSPISPAMVAAGAAIILDRCEDIVFADDMARDVFSAMIAVSPPATARD